MQHRPTQTKMYASQLQYSSMMGSIWRSSSTDILRRLLCASSLLLLSFWSMSTMMPDTLGATIEGNSTRVASSSAKTSLAHSARYIVLAHSAKCIVTSKNQPCTYHCRYRRRALSLLLRLCLQGWTDKTCVGNILSVDGATRKIPRTPSSDMLTLLRYITLRTGPVVV